MWPVVLNQSWKQLPSKKLLTSHHINYPIKTIKTLREVPGVMVIVVGNEHGDTSSNPGKDRLHFT